MQCPHCQQNHNPSMQYCPLTGKKISEGQEAAPPPGPVPPPAATARQQTGRWLPLALGAVLVVMLVLFGAVVVAMLRKVPYQAISATVAAAAQTTGTSRPAETLPPAALATSPAAAVIDIPGRMAFETTRDGNLEIYVMNANGSGQTNLSRNPAEDADPSWSGDGQKIAFTTNRDGNWEIYAMQADGSQAVNLSNHSADDAYPAWSPDGKKIAFTSNRDGNLEIYVMDADGSNPIRLTRDDAKESFPDWSPDGQQIVFQSIPDKIYGSAQLQVMNAFGSGKTGLGSKHGVAGLYPAWSPDGRRVAFVSDRKIGWEIISVEIDTGQEIQLTQRLPQQRISQDLNNSLPAWSPDGQYLAFASARDQNSEIYVMKADGSQPVNLSNHPGYDGFPDWQPQAGGQQLAGPAPAPAARGTKPDGSPIDANMACAVHEVGLGEALTGRNKQTEFALSCLEKDGWHVYKTLITDDPAELAAWVARFLPPSWPDEAASTQLPGWMVPCSNGRYYLLVDDHLYLYDGDQPVEITPDGYRRAGLLTCGPGGDLWVRLVKEKPQSVPFVLPPIPNLQNRKHEIDPDVAVSHFDGSAWTHYPASATFGSGNDVDHIQSIAVAPGGAVWVASMSSISVLDGGQWKNYEMGKDFMNRPVDQMVIDSKGRVWATTNDGLVGYDGQKWTNYEDGVPQYIHYASQLAVDAQDRLWVAIDYRRQIHRFDPRTNQWALIIDSPEIGSNTIHGLQLDRQGRAWVSTDYGLLVFAGDRPTTYLMSNSDLYADWMRGVMLFGEGPALPAPVAKAPGSIQGKLINADPKVFENVSMELHGGPLDRPFPYDQQAKQPFFRQMAVAADGSFLFEDVPPGRYHLVIRAGQDSWVSNLRSEVKPNQRTDTGASNYPPEPRAPVVSPFSATATPPPATTAATPTPAPSLAPTLAATRAPASPAQTFRLVTHAQTFPAFSAGEAWLEFLIPPGQNLAGSVIVSALSAGELEIVLPGGERKTFAQYPAPDSQMAGMTFENYNQEPGGPQIRIALRDLIANPTTGRYQISWKSGSQVSNVITLNWDGSALTVQE